MTKNVLKTGIEDAINLVVQSGIRVPERASMLMAYGLNTSNQQGDVGFHLPGFIQFMDVPREVSPEDKESMKEDFRHWIIGNGFRELLEGLETFLNSLFSEVAKAGCHFQGKSPKKAEQLIKSFERFGVKDKLDHLEVHYGFKTGMGHYFRSLTQVRNCLTHRRGIVGDKDCGKGSALELRWLGIDTKITECDGTEHIITLDTIGPIESSKFNSDDNAQLKITYVDRTLTFAKGARITIHPRSLQEICSMSTYTCFKLHQLVMNWLLDHGVFVNNGERFIEPHVDLLLDATLPGESSSSGVASSV